MGPLHFEPTAAVLEVPPARDRWWWWHPPRRRPARRGSPSSRWNRSYRSTLPTGARVVVSRLGGADVTVPPWAVVGLGRQDELLSQADLVICGGGHGIVAKALLAGVPMVVVPAAETSGRSRIVLCAKEVRGSSGR